MVGLNTEMTHTASHSFSLLALLAWQAHPEAWLRERVSKGHMKCFGNSQLYCDITRLRAWFTRDGIAKNMFRSG